MDKLDIKHKALTEALRKLDAIGASYKIAFNGSQYSRNEDAFGSPGKPNGKAANGEHKIKRPRTGATAYVKPHITDMTSGEVRVIPASDKYTLDQIQRLSASIMGLMYGRSAFMTAIAGDRKGVEVMRY